ncbi:MAG: GTPase [Xanthomonas sp.]|nr:GTPase [Xanthomonas sp.]MBL8257681.1 ATP/GTP-binding protein [Pseudoxanthomonas mexicana]
MPADAGAGQRHRAGLRPVGLPVRLRDGGNPGVRRARRALAGSGAWWLDAGAHVAQPAEHRLVSPREHKIVVLGAMGAGKSTLVRALAGDRMVDTDVANTDAASDKLSTTVAMDYADIDLPNGDRLRLYGTPGQARFDFIWPVLLQGASGVLVLADASVPAFVADLDRYLRTLRDHAPDVAAAIGVSKLDLAPHADIDALATRAMDLLRALPVVPFDPRSDAAVMMLMDVLMSEIEAMDLVGSHG